MKEAASPVVGAVYESLRSCKPDRRPTRLMVTTAGLAESTVVDAYTGRRARTIPSARLHEVAYYVDTRRYARSGYLRLDSVAGHVLDIVSAALAARGLDQALANGANFSRDPLRGGTITLACQPGHPAIMTCVSALASIGRSAVLIRDSHPGTVLRVRYGSSQRLCPVRWLTRDNWTMNYCGKLLGHPDGEHFDSQTCEMWWDGDDDRLDWPAQRAPHVPGEGTGEASPLSGRQATDLPVLDNALDPDERTRLPDHTRKFVAQLRTTALRRSERPGLRTFGPMDQEMPDMQPGTCVVDGTGSSWSLRSDGLWTSRGSTGAVAEGRAACIPWYLLAFQNAPLTEQLLPASGARG